MGSVADQIQQLVKQGRPTTQGGYLDPFGNAVNADGTQVNRGKLPQYLQQEANFLFNGPNGAAGPGNAVAPKPTVTPNGQGVDPTIIATLNYDAKIAKDEQNRARGAGANVVAGYSGGLLGASNVRRRTLLGT